MRRKCLVMLDWPLDKQRVFKQRDSCGVDKIFKFCPSSSPILQEDLLDFISQLSKHRPGQLLEISLPDNLIKHRLFRTINFERLRAKKLPAPIHGALKGAIPLKPAWYSELLSDYVQLQSQAGPEHRRYCFNLSKEQKDWFETKFIG